MKRYLNFVLMLLAAGSLFYMAYLFTVQLFSPGFKLMLWESDPLILATEIAVIIVAAAFCIVKAALDLKHRAK